MLVWLERIIFPDKETRTQRSMASRKSTNTIYETKSLIKMLLKVYDSVLEKDYIFIPIPSLQFPQAQSGHQRRDINWFSLAARYVKLMSLQEAGLPREQYKHYYRCLTGEVITGKDGVMSGEVFVPKELLAASSVPRLLRIMPGEQQQGKRDGSQN